MSGTKRYLVTIHETGNITDKADNVRMILTSTDQIAPRERVEVEEVPESHGVMQVRWGDWS